MKPIEKVPMVTQVVEGVQALISERGLREKEKLPTEKELCHILNVSRSTVREALRMLQALDVVELLPGKGAYVASPSRSGELMARRWLSIKGVKLQDIVEIREAIEPLSARLAIQRASPEEIAELARLHSLFIQAATAQNPLQLATYDELFHLEIARCTHNQLMVDIQDAIKKDIFEIRVKSFSIPGRMATAIEPHEAILGAFYRHDADDGVRAMTKHIHDAYADVIYGIDGEEQGAKAQTKR